MSQTILPTRMPTVRLRCTAGRGMFPHEAGVLIRGVDQFYECIIDAELVHTEGLSRHETETPAVIEVQVVKANETKLLVELPRQVVSGGRRIWVPQSEVVS